MQELTLKEIYNTLLPKLKVLLIILLIGAVVGGCVGVAATRSSITYGTTIEFYVNPKKSEEGCANQSQFAVYGSYGSGVMDTMTKLLASDTFAEYMLLDADGLPVESVLERETDRTEIDAKIAEARAAISEVESAKEAESGVSKEELVELEIIAQAKISEVIELCKQTKAYSDCIEIITKSVSYSFYDRDVRISSTETLATCFIYVNITTTEGEATAKFIYERINEVLPRFVEEHMAKPSGYDGTNCQRVSRLDEIKQMGSRNILVEAIKYAVIFGLLAFVLSMAFIVFVKRFKKWSAQNKTVQDAKLNTSDVALGDGAVRLTSESNDKGEGAPEWQ